MLAAVKKQLFPTLLIFAFACSAHHLIIPFSLTNFIGPMAAIASVLALTIGHRIFVAIIMSGILFHSYLIVLGNESFGFSIAIFLMLVFSLQAYITKLLCAKDFNENKLLKHRNTLIWFMIKLGPLTNLMAALSAVLVAIIENQQFSSSLFYVFASVWSFATLTSVFMVPIFIFQRTNTTTDVGRSKKNFVVFASVIGFVGISLLLNLSQRDDQAQRAYAFEQDTKKVELILNEEIDFIREQIRALTALFYSSEYVSLEEFTQFSSYIFKQNSSIRALEWLPIIKHEHQQAFEQQASDVLNFNYKVRTGVATNGYENKVIPGVYAPVYFIFPSFQNNQAYGVDINNFEQEMSAHMKAVEHNDLVASRPITLVQDDYSNPGVLVYFPLYNLDRMNPYGGINVGERQGLSGYILAVVQFKAFFNQVVQQQGLSNIQLQVSDVSEAEPFTLFGQTIVSANRLDTVTELDFFYRQWQLKFAELDPWFFQNKSWKVWTLLIGSTVGGVLFQLLLLLGASSSTELSHQVSLKTKELLLAREQADQASDAKSDILVALEHELQQPLDKLNQQLPLLNPSKRTDGSNAIYQNILQANENLQQTYQTLNQLADIESGRTQLEDKLFDFHAFLKRIETNLNVKHCNQHSNIKFVQHKNVPVYITADESHLQQLLIGLLTACIQDFNSYKLKVSVKAHLYQSEQASLFFMITEFDDYAYRVGDNRESNDNVDTEKDASEDFVSTNMLMVEQLKSLFDGEIKYSPLSSGSTMVSLTLRVGLSSIEKQLIMDDLDFQIEQEQQAKSS